MKTEKLPQTREELLQLLINRKEPRAYDKDAKYCVYDRDVNGGCAIGMALSKKDSKRMGTESISSIVEDNIYNLPIRLINMGSTYLEEVQRIHDNDNNWVESEEATVNRYGTVWSNKGIIGINNIIKKYELDIPLI